MNIRNSYNLPIISVPDDVSAQDLMIINLEVGQVQQKRLLDMNVQEMIIRVSIQKITLMKIQKLFLIKE